MSVSTLDTQTQFRDRQGNTVSFELDTSCESPRTSQSNLGLFLIWSRSYASPDSPGQESWPYPGWDSVPSLEQLAEDYEIDPDELMEMPGNPIANFCQEFNERGLGVAMPVSMADHSGVSYGVGDPSQFVGAYPWDAGWAGLIMADNEVLDKEYLNLGVSRDDAIATAKKVMESEVEEYDAWARGDCWRYNVTAPDGTLVESVGGFIGDNAKQNGMADYLDIDSLEPVVETSADEPCPAPLSPEVQVDQEVSDFEL